MSDTILYVFYDSRWLDQKECSRFCEDCEQGWAFCICPPDDEAAREEA